MEKIKKKLLVGLIAACMILFVGCITDPEEEETYTSSPPPASASYSFYDAWWSNTVDADNDGYAESAHLCWDTDVSNNLTKNVQVKVYYRSEGSSIWNFISTTSCHEISGSSGEDAYYISLYALSRGAYEFLLVLYECDGSTIKVSLTPSNSSSLDNRLFEPTAAPPTTTYSFYDAWWTQIVDADNDGYRESGVLVWDADVSGEQIKSIVVMIYYRVVGTSSWACLGSTSCYEINGTSGTDAYGIELTSNCTAVYEFKLVLYECGGSSVKATLTPSDDSALDNELFEPAF